MLLIFSACFNIPGIIKITYFCILPFQLWNNDLLFPLWKKSLTFLNFLTMLHLKQFFSTFIFSICASPRIFLAVWGGQCPLLFIYLCWVRLCHFCFLVVNVNIFFISSGRMPWFPNIYFQLSLCHIHLHNHFFKPLFLLEEITEHSLSCILFSWPLRPPRDLPFSQCYFYKLLP